jgi:hypothetical protein
VLPKNRQRSPSCRKTATSNFKFGLCGLLRPARKSISVLRDRPLISTRRDSGIFLSAGNTQVPIALIKQIAEWNASLTLGKVAVFNNAVMYMSSSWLARTDAETLAQDAVLGHYVSQDLRKEIAPYLMPHAPDVAVLDLRDRSVARGQNPSETGQAPLEIPRTAKHLVLDLPIGSKEGSYEVALLNEMITARPESAKSLTSDMNRCQGRVHLSPRPEPILSRRRNCGPPGLASAAQK